MSDPIVNSNSPEASASPPAARRKSPGRLLEVGIVFGVILVIAGAAFFQEPIGAFFRLHLWDRSAPTKVVNDFMTAVQKGDQEKAQSVMGTADLKPLLVNGKWVGYYMDSIAGRTDYLPDDLAPSQGQPQASDPVFIAEADVAEVMTKVGTGKSLKYRLKWNNGVWKIQEIQGGRIHHK